MRVDRSGRVQRRGRVRDDCPEVFTLGSDGIAYGGRRASVHAGCQRCLSSVLDAAARQCIDVEASPPALMVGSRAGLTGGRPSWPV